MLQVNPRSVINWIEQDLLDSYRTPGGHRRIRRDDLLAFLRKHKIPMPAPLVDGKFEVLIVEDEEESMRMLTTYFERHGNYELHSVSDGISALIEVGRRKPALLILDMRIPGVDGVEVCRRIKADSKNTTAIIAISGSRDLESKVLQSGADVFMAKPFDLEKLHEEAKRLLRIL